MADVLLRRIDSTKSMNRFYAIRLAPCLFGGVSVVREWGRIGSPGRVRCDDYMDEAAARAALDRLVRAKRRRGYA